MKMRMFYKLFFCLIFAWGTGAVAATEVVERQGEFTPREASQENADVRLVNPALSRVLTNGTMGIPSEVLNKLDPDQLSRFLREQARKPQSIPELIFQENILVPGIVFTTFAVIAFLFAYYSYRQKRELMLTVQVAIQSGQALPDSFIDSLQRKRKPLPDADLRKAVLLMALGVSAIVIVLVFGASFETRRLAAIGILPTLLGGAYLFLWRYSQKKAGIS